jgi:hypothetical protein
MTQELKSVSFCRRWGIEIPSTAGPYSEAWGAHNKCPVNYHGLFIFIENSSIEKNLGLESGVWPTKEDYMEFHGE